MDAPLSANSVIAGVDGSAAAVHAVRWAAEAAQRSGLPLQLAHAIPPPPANPYPTMVEHMDTLRRAARQEGEEFLGTAAVAARQVAPTLTVSCWQRVGQPIDVLSLASATARVMVVGATGQTGLVELLAGSTALSLPSRAHCPVVVVPHRRHGAGPADGPVVVGVEGTPLDDPVIGFAFEQASMLGVELIAVHSWSDSPLPDIDRITGQRDHWNLILGRERRLLAEGLAGFGERHPDVSVRPIVVYDKPARALVDYGRSAQLLVVGSHGRGRFPGALLGSTSRAATKLSPCPIAVVARDR
jgi:nucleotide-binding universal stress UspA family protein